jgi:cephalosporin hydroxylase
MNQILPYKSLRFFPHWNVNSTDQVIGLMEMVDYITYDGHNQHWVEIGSYYGESATIFLGFPKIAKLDCVDISKKSIDFLENKLSPYIKSNRCLLHHCSSESYSETLADNSIDVVYIDADHSYESVCKDLALYYPKVMIEGYLCGHDYSVSWPGVIKAVDQFASSLNYHIKIFKDASWLLQKR